MIQAPLFFAMKFRIFLGLICLAFVAVVLLYGAPDGSDMSADAEASLSSTPDFLPEIAENLSCDGQEIAISTRPLVIGMVGRPNSLLPFDNTTRSQLEQELSQLVFRGLVRFTLQGEPLPDLASWEVAENGQTVTFRLDQGALWHDGIPVNAADVVFTFNQLAAGNYTVPGNFPWNTVSITQIDDFTVQINLPVAYVPLLEAATVGLLPAHLNLTAQGLESSDFAAQPIGNGPYRVENNWRSDGFIFMSAFTDSFIQSLEVRFYPSVDNMMVDFNADGLDIALFPDHNSVLALEGVPADSYRLFSGPTNRLAQLFFRMDAEEESPIADANVRKALQLGLDRRNVLAAALMGQGVLADGPFGVDSRFNEAVQFPLIQTDVAAAGTLLDEAGWLVPEASLSGVREKEGQPLTINVLLPQSAVMSQIGAQLDTQWSDLGAVVNVQTLPAAQVTTAIEQRAFDVTVQTIRLARDPDVYHFYSQEAIVRGENVARWNHRPSSEALEAGRQVWEFELRKPYYTAFRSFYDAQVPGFALYQEIRSIVVSQNVGGSFVGHPGNLVEFMRPFPQWYILGSDLDDECFTSDS